MELAGASKIQDNYFRTKNLQYYFWGPFLSIINLTTECCSTCLQLFSNFTPGGKDDGVINAGINMMDKEQDV